MVDMEPAARAQDGRKVDDPRRTDAPRQVPMPLDAPSTSRGTAAPARNAPVKKGMLERVGNELGQLRDEVFAGVTGFSANLQAMNASAAAHQLLQRQEMLAKLVGEGRGDSAQAQGLRTAIAHASQRLGGMAADTAEAGALADAASRMTTRPQVRAVTEAKSFSESWEAFKKDPYAVVAGATAQSVPQLIPMLIAAAAMGPIAGAAVAGGTSALTEFGSGIREFARDNGVDPSDKDGLGKLFSDPKMLREAMAYAGKGGAIVGSMDAVSGGLARKTLVPKVFKNQAVRQAINAPLQAGVQAAFGGAGEAGKQLAQKGEIDQPGQVLAEMAGGLGAAPVEVLALSKDARQGWAERTGELFQKPTARAPATAPMQLSSEGTLSVKGDPFDLRARLSAAGVDKVFLLRDGVWVAPVQAVQAQQALVDSWPSLTQQGASNVQDGVRLIQPDGATDGMPSPGDATRRSQLGFELLDAGTLSIEGDPQTTLALLHQGGVTQVLSRNGGVLVAAGEVQKAIQVLAETAAPLSISVRNAILDAPRVGYGMRGQGSGNKVDQVSNQLVLDSQGEPIPVYAGDLRRPPYATREFPDVPRVHGFTDMVDNYAGRAQVFPLRQGVTLYQLSGSLGGVQGRFEWIVDDNMGGVSHRMFVPTGAINGIAVQP